MLCRVLWFGWCRLWRCKCMLHLQGRAIVQQQALTIASPLKCMTQLCLICYGVYGHEHYLLQRVRRCHEP